MRRILLIAIMLISYSLTFAQSEDFVEATIDVDAPYIGQPVIYTIRVFTTRDVQDAAVIEPRFNGFGRASFVADAIVSSESRNSTAYTVIEYSLLLYPLRAGEQMIDPFRIEIPETPFEAATSVQTDTLTVNVQPLLEGAPQSFKNAVGQFDIEATIDNPTIAAGDAITLSVTVNGTGNIEQIIAPDIAIPTTWRNFPQPPITNQETLRFAEKTFAWAILPDTEGEFEFPPIEFSFFNPQTLTYETRLTTPFAITVTEGNAASAQQSAQINRFEQVREAPALKTPAQSFLPPLTPVLFWLLWLIPPLIALALWLPRRTVSRPRQGRSRRVRGSNALTRSRDQLKAAQSAEPRLVYQQVQKTILDYLSTKSGMQVGGDEVPSKIGHLPLKLQHLLIQCLEEAASGQYAPVSRDDANTLLLQTLKILNAVEKAWQK